MNNLDNPVVHILVHRWGIASPYWRNVDERKGKTVSDRSSLRRMLRLLRRLNPGVVTHEVVIKREHNTYVIEPSFSIGLEISMDAIRPGQIRQVWMTFENQMQMVLAMGLIVRQGRHRCQTGKRNEKETATAAAI